MKILEIYNCENNFGELTKNPDNSFTRIEKFLADKRLDYADNYYTNKDRLKVFLYDKLLREYVGEFDVVGDNIEIKITHPDHLTHELLHMASYDFYNPEKYAYCSLNEGPANALSEGMTEYLASIIDNVKVDCYYFESFIARMLNTTQNIWQYYFVPDYDRFIELYNEKDILNLMINSNIYNKRDDKIEEITQEEVSEAIINSLEALILIEFSKEKDLTNIVKYRDEFLSLLEGSDIKTILDEYNKEYFDFSKKLMDAKIRERKL